MEMIKEFDNIGDRWIFYPIGDIDIYNSSIFKDEIIKSYEEKKADILIDGKDLDYMDSTGLGALIYLLNRLKDSDNEIHLQNVKPNIKKILDITELNKLFHIRGEYDE